MGWQLRQTVNPGERKVKFIGNTYLMVTKGMAGATGNIYTGLHEFSEMGFLLHFLQPGDLFADVGANIGSYTILAAGCKGANTVAFEPHPETYKILEKNISINKVNEIVKTFNLGVGSERKTLQLTFSHDTVNHVVTRDEKETDDQIDIQVVPLDDVFKEEVPILIKIDVEGYEMEVIRGMEKTIKDHRLKAIIIELNGSGERYGFNDDTIVTLLKEAGFQQYAYDPFTRTCIPNLNHDSQNALYLRDFNFVSSRLTGAKKINVFSEAF